MKKVLALLLVLLMVAALAACGQSGNNSSTPSSKAENSESSGEESSEAEDSSQATNEGNSGEVVKITMGGWGDFNTEHEAGTEGMADAIGVEVEFQKYPTDSAFWDNLPAQIAAKRQRWTTPTVGPTTAIHTTTTSMSWEATAPTSLPSVSMPVPG